MRVIICFVFSLNSVNGGWMMAFISSEFAWNVFVIFFMMRMTWGWNWSIFWANAFFS